MADHIEAAKAAELDYILAGYGNKMMYHKYERGKLSAGAPLTMDTAKKVFKFLNSKVSDISYRFRGLIPKNVLKFSTEDKYIIWQTPSRMQHVLYKQKHMTSGNYIIPALVWVLIDNSLYMYAVSKTVTKETDKLYQAPFFNLGSGGSVCMGSAKFTSPSHYYEDIMKKVEAGFWTSYFTHTNCDDLLTVNFLEWAEQNVNVIHKTFDVKLLTDRKKTIKDLIR